jgi:hypothetical protein
MPTGACRNGAPFRAGLGRYLERHFSISINAESTDQCHDRALAFIKKNATNTATTSRRRLFTEVTTEHGLYAKPPSAPPVCCHLFQIDHLPF